MDKKEVGLVLGYLKEEMTSAGNIYKFDSSELTFEKLKKEAETGSDLGVKIIETLAQDGRELLVSLLMETGAFKDMPGEQIMKEPSFDKYCDMLIGIMENPDETSEILGSGIPMSNKEIVEKVKHEIGVYGMYDIALRNYEKK